MVRVYATRLMRESEVSLRHRGRIVWSGLLGALPSANEFDTVALSVVDCARLQAFAGTNLLDCRTATKLLAEWYCGGELDILDVD